MCNQDWQPLVWKFFATGVLACSPTIDASNSLSQECTVSFNPWMYWVIFYFCVFVGPLLGVLSPAFLVWGVPPQLCVILWSEVCCSFFYIYPFLDLKRSLGFPILLFSSISLRWSLRKAFLSLCPCYSLELCIQMGISFLFSVAFHVFCFLSYLSVLLGYFAFLHLFFLYITACCTVSRTSVYSSSGTLWNLIPWIYFSLPLYNHKGFDLGHTWMA